MPTFQFGFSTQTPVRRALDDRRRGRRPLPAWASDVSFGFLLALCLSLLSCQNSCPSGQIAPQGYTCGTLANPGNCEATVSFASGTPQSAGSFVPKLFGFRTTLAVANSISAGDGSVGNSMRLKSADTSNFIEIGYFNVAIANSIYCPQGGLTYFAAAIDNGVASIQCLTPVPAADIGRNVVLTIASVGPDLTQSSVFKVTISTPNITIDVCASTTYCTNTLWNAGGQLFGSVDLVQRLVGSTGAAASTSTFVFNSFQVSQSGFDFETANELASFTNPPFGGVLQSASVAGSQGGTYFFECCLAPSTVWPAQVDFGTVTVGSTETKTITVTNVQSSFGNLNIANVSIGGTNAGDFTQTNTCSSLAPLASCTVTVTFKPTQQGSRTATLTVTDSGGSGSGSDQSTLVGSGR